MFHTIITLAYVLPNIYVFLRIGNLFICTKYRPIYAVIYLLLFLIYPLSNIISEDSSGFLVRAIEIISGYLLPFYLYLFLILLVFDIIMLLNRLLKIIPLQKPKSAIFRTYGLILILLIPLTFVIIVTYS